MGFEGDSKNARVTVELKARGIKNDSRVIVGLSFIRGKESNRQL